MSIDVIVCNLTRFGDLLQSQQLINDLSLNGYRVGLLCLSNFTSAVSLLRNVSETIALPGSHLLARIDDAWPVAVNIISNFARNVKNEVKPRFIINLTPSLPARLLTRLLSSNGAEVFGFAIDKLGYGFNAGVWGSFFSVAASHRMNAPFNLADMMSKLGSRLAGKLHGDFHLATPSDSDLNWAEKFLAENINVTSQKFISFQLGASENRRRWPVEYFCFLGDRLWQEAKAVPVLLGSDSEIQLAQRYKEKANHPFINAVGKTNLLQLAAMLRHTELLVTNDTGTMHLASGQGIPCLAFFFASAQPCDTGPLLEGCCCIEPALDCHPCQYNQCCTDIKCRKYVSPQIVGDMVIDWLKTKNWRECLRDGIEDECRVWITSRDENNFHLIERIDKNRADSRGAMIDFLRHFWGQLLDELECLEVGVNKVRTVKNYEIGQIMNLEADMARSISMCLKKSAEMLDITYSLGLMATKNRQIAQKFLLNCERLQALLDSCESLSTVALFWREFRQNQGGDLPTFLQALPVMSRNFLNYNTEIERILCKTD